MIRTLAGAGATLLAMAGKALCVLGGIVGLCLILALVAFS